MSYPQNIKVTVDALVFSFQHDILHILLIQRKSDPFKGMWAFPGGFVEDDEPLVVAARRELEEETGIKVSSLYQFHTFGKPDRDPRGRTISVAYLTLVDHYSFRPEADTDAKQVQWFPINALPPLAFDHDHIINRALAELHLIQTRAKNQTQHNKDSFTNADFLLIQHYLDKIISSK